MDKIDNLKNSKIVIFTDGSCNRKIKLGGIGIILLYKNEKITISKGFSNTTSPRMELIAVIEALSNVNITHLPIEIFCDNQYSCYIWQKQWYRSWEEQDFLGTANKDLIVRYLEQFRRFTNIKINWIRGHGRNNEEDINILNEEADQLANYKQFTMYLEDTRT